MLAHNPSSANSTELVRISNVIPLFYDDYE
jgi:hypothetical protein